MTTPKKAVKLEPKGNRDTFKAFLDTLVGNQTITADVAGIIGHAMDAHPELDDKVSE